MDKIQQEFQKATRELVIRRVRICSLITMFLVPLFGFLDLVATPFYFSFFMTLRMTCGGIIFIIYGCSFLSFFKRSPRVLGIILLTLIGITISTMTRFIGGYESGYYAGLNLIFLGMGLLIPWGLKDAIFTGIMVYASYLVPIFIMDDVTNWAIFSNNNFFLTATLLIALIATFLGHQYRWAEFQANFNLKKSNDALAQAKQELELSYQKLKELDHAKMEFFANVSHELRTPLTLILAPMESMIKGKVGVSETVQKGLLEIMYHNALRLLKLINNLLDLAKLDAGRMELYLAKADLNQFIRGIVASIEPMAEKKEIGLSCQFPGTLPETFIDRDKIEKVILNLVFNSIKFTEAGGKVMIHCVQEDHQFRFCIEDTGIGIPQNYLPRIFERFSQADTSATRKYEGTGIGMALAKEFVELHQGKIWVESEVGKGTKVFFTLPYLTQVSELEAKPDKRMRPAVEVEQKKRELDWTRELHQQALYHGEERAPLSASEPDPQMRLSGRTLLIVEDNLDMLNFISFQLEDQYRLLKAQNGVEGLEAAKKNIPDLIISDVMMPLKDGYQLCREIKSDPRTKHIPVILLTAKADLTMKIEGLEQGADEYLTKPFSSDELRARIQTLLSSRDLERQLQIRNDELVKALKELKEAQMQLVQSAKMASVGQLAAGIAHEMNNPLTYVSSSIFALERQFQKIREGQAEMSNFLDHSQPLLERIDLGVKRTKSIIDDLMNFARKDVHALKEEDINEGIRSVLTLLESRLSDKIKLHLELGDIPKVECVLGQINQVVMNLLLNALDAVSGKGEIWINTVAQDGHVNIRIKDTGKGIPEGAQSRIFEPFFTTKDVGKGTGLGLSISHKIIEDHHGKIDFRSEMGKGTEFQIQLPIRQFAVEGAAR